ncbi:MAG: tungstate ABC transporter substrate-binding protein WtpA [Anaerolineales bacterium]|nr:tungstate ABC transporter substrate-binding protein WtpA [Anaerolineales bacterium]
MKPLPSILFAALFCLATLTNGCAASPSTGTPGGSSGRTPLVVFAAGSLIIPFGDLEKAFESQYPDIDIQAQYHGSIQVIRHVTDLHIPIDVVATADASLVPMLMYATNDPDTGLAYADWYIRFASNRLALAYRPDSKYAPEINADNWYEILSRPDVKVGLADPRFDAVGYRALMVYALARNYYHQPTIFMDMFKGQFSFPLGIFSENTLTTITIPEIVETKTGAHIVLRGASIQLIALLESGDLDYAFEYESVIHQHGLSLLGLPDALNLGEEAYQQIYSTVQVNEDFQRFASVKPVFRGERIGYGITIPENAPHPAEAALFVVFLLGPQGRVIMEADYHPLFDPALCNGYSRTPTALQSLCVPAEVP